MNGLGRLIKDGLDITGEFFSDHFVRPVEANEISDSTLRSYLIGQ